ncbi:MAG: sulfotransferase [Pseudomonadales bacterium]
MTIRVIGAGFGRNGTLSLKLALEQLGFDKCYHMMEVFQHPDHVRIWRDAAAGRPVDWDALFEGYQSSCDWPSCTFWQEQMAHYPDARVILSERDPERWYQSVMSTIYPGSLAQRASDDPANQAWAAMAFELVWDGTFHGRIEDKDYAIATYLAHNQKVKDTVPADRLLVYQASEGWQPLCAFLGCEVPATPYPQVNTTEEFQGRVHDAQAQQQQ